VLRLQQAGVDVFFGAGHFIDPTTVAPIPGLDTIPFLTNESLFERTELPRHLQVIGGGAIGCELVQAFSRVGATIFGLAARRRRGGRPRRGRGRSLADVKSTRLCVRRCVLRP
jgi:hypothetical protein